MSGLWGQITPKLVLAYDNYRILYCPLIRSTLVKGAAHVTHWSLYALMIVLPLTGMATWFGGSALADTTHTSLKFPLLLLFALHVLGALFQQCVLKSGLMQRTTRAQS